MIGIWTAIVVVVFFVALSMQERFPYTMGQFAAVASIGFLIAFLLDALMDTL